MKWKVWTSLYANPGLGKNAEVTVEKFSSLCHSTKQWLLKNDLIKIAKAGKVSPHFNRKMCHN